MPSNDITTIKRPCNLKAEDEALFAEGQYNTPPNKVVQIENASVLFNGIVMRAFSPVKESYYQYPESKWGFIKKAYEQYIVSSYSRSRGFVKYSDKPLVVINQPWFNFYHWVLESLPRLFLAKEHLKTSALLLPQAYAKFSFVTDTLKILAPRAEVIYHSDQNYKASKVYLPALRPFCHQYNVELLHNFSQHMLQQMGLTDVKPQRKIMLVRTKANARRIQNSSVIETIATANGFEVVDMEDYSFAEQVRLMRSASHVVAQHGAGLTHILFMHPNARVLELHKALTNASDHVSQVYVSLASAMNVDYYYMFCQPTDPNADFFKADIKVDVLQFEQELRNFIAP